MLNVSTVLTYLILLLVSTGKRSFRKLRTFIKKSGDTIARLLQPAEVSLKHSQSISQSMFCKKKRLYCIIDDTLIKKNFSLYMQGAGMFFDTNVKLLLGCSDFKGTVIRLVEHATCTEAR